MMLNPGKTFHMVKLRHFLLPKFRKLQIFLNWNVFPFGSDEVLTSESLIKVIREELAILTITFQLNHTRERTLKASVSSMHGLYWWDFDWMQVNAIRSGAADHNLASCCLDVLVGDSYFLLVKSALQAYHVQVLCHWSKMIQNPLLHYVERVKVIATQEVGDQNYFQSSRCLISSHYL